MLFRSNCLEPDVYKRQAIQCSGYSFSIASGYPIENDVTLSENLEWTRKIVESVDIPVMADGEDGYGGPEKVIDTIKNLFRQELQVLI